MISFPFRRLAKSGKWKSIINNFKFTVTDDFKCSYYEKQTLFKLVS